MGARHSSSSASRSVLSKPQNTDADANTTAQSNANKYLQYIELHARDITLQDLVNERTPRLHLAIPGANDPLVKPGVVSADALRAAAARYLYYGASLKQWETAWEHVDADAVYVFCDNPGDVAVGRDAIVKRLRDQIAFLPYADYSDIRSIYFGDNCFQFYILNKLRPHKSERVYVIANFSVVWASHVDTTTGRVMFGAFRDMYDKTQFVLTILEYLKEDLENGGDAAVQFVKAGGHQMLENVPEWLWKVLPHTGSK